MASAFSLQHSSFNVVVHTPDVVGDRMAGPGIRAWHLAAELGKHVPTRLIARSEGSAPNDVTLIEHGSSDAREALRNASVLVGQPARAFGKRRREQRIVYDLFDPTVLELRELYGNAPSMRQRVHLAAEWWRLTEALSRADLLVCAASKQRELYERLQSGDAPWIEVPFGVDLAESRVCEKSKDDIVVWGGGIWEWLDPATAVDAIVRLNEDGLRARLLFLGRARPNRNLIDRRRDDRFDALLARGGAHVSANAEWIPYRERLSWLRAGKIAIMLHRRTAEADYSIRTRLFDAIAAGIPVVASEGGFAAELVEREGLGIVVPPENVDAVAEAIRRLLTNDDLYITSVRNLERIRPRFAWEVVTRPLVSAIMQWQT
ncbi:MAG TPA: glycosyltransferase [Thermoanaerobaculia bacterium]|nr:glycosyltransferase [Thermoanaerobaculia bacterium]